MPDFNLDSLSTIETVRQLEDTWKNNPLSAEKKKLRTAC
jgi:hypothetical protein